MKLPSKITLTDETISRNDIQQLADWLTADATESPQLTKGEQTRKFEEEFAKYVGAQYAVFVNSGSSANLLMVELARQTLKQDFVSHNFRLKNKYVIVPMLCWATDVAPLLQLGFTPVFIGHDDDYQPNFSQLEEALERTHASMFLCVSALGYVPNMGILQSICRKYHCEMIGDHCESLGAKCSGAHLDSYCKMNSYSFYFSHHISTIEGGMVTTNNSGLFEALKRVRSHGWIRDSVNWESYEKRFGFKAKYMFDCPGFNVRNTDIAAYLGRMQLRNHLDKFIKKRNENFKFFQEEAEKMKLKHFKPQNTGYSSFAIPHVSECSNRMLAAFLDDHYIECRPLICGDITQQNMLAGYDYIDLIPPSQKEVAENRAIYLPNHPGLSKKDIKRMVTTLKEFEE